MSDQIQSQCIVGRAAPDFTAPAVMSNNSIDGAFHLRDYVEHSPYVLFFYPLDFTFVCPTELIELNRIVETIYEAKAKVIAISVDSQFSHHKYVNTPVNEGGIGRMNFPIVSDLNKGISSNYGVLSPGGVSLRATVIVDTKNIVQHMTINNAPIGRNIGEIQRVLDAIHFYEKHGEVCPANWSSGKPAITPSPDGIVRFLNDHYT